MKNMHLAGIILVIIGLVILWVLFANKTIDSFIVFLEDVIIPKDCFNYILTDGQSYFLLNTNKMFDSVSNPLKFKTLEEAKTHLARLKLVYPDGKNVKCPTNIPLVKFTQNKKTDDPTVSYERICNKKTATNLFDVDVCTVYEDSGNPETKAKNELIMQKLKKMETDSKVYSNYDVETCMMNDVMKENPELDDTNFKAYFADHFNRLGSTIDPRFDYITM